MKRIPTFGEFIGEGYLTKITKEYFGEDERLEERIELPEGVERVSFTDKNGDFHPKGYRVTDGNPETLTALIAMIYENEGDGCDLNCIDVSNMTSLNSVFKLTKFNCDISGWDVSKVKNMSYMFYYSRFNGDISKWDVSKVEDMYGMFKHSKFNGDISGWDVSNVDDMSDMFSWSPLEDNPPKWYKEDNIILKYKDFLKEGYLTKITKEYFGEDERLEDRFDSNIKDMEEVDLGPDFPVVFADRDLVVNGTDRFDWYETRDMVGRIEEMGWKLPEWDSFNEMFYTDRFKHTKKRNLESKWAQFKGGVITNTDTKKKLFFENDGKFSETYWCDDDNDWVKTAHENGRCFNVGNNGYQLIVASNNENKNHKCKIRLVRPKEHK